ncbi:MAG: DUF3536 domain-containing protein [Gemmatimonadota bacterium]
MTQAPPTDVTSIIIHGHYYQPPRENPWLEEVEIEPTAAPFHDWNQRIEQESYRAVVAARVLGHEGRIASVLNTLSYSSFNFGPTLLSWMESAAPDTYAAILEADRESIRRLGHGNAIAQPYHHVILPLSTRRDKVTEVRWGIADFRRRFGREPEGMWLPETAVDDETLDVLASEGIRFTILAPYQVTALPPSGLPGLYRTKSGRSITVCLYDGQLAQGVAFGELLRDAGLWIARLRVSAADHRGGVVAIATDGETYGHHHKFGEMALARVISEFSGETSVGGPSASEITIENFASFLARHPATHEVELVAPSSWSCAHGVERWRSECGCKIAPDRPTQQKWRAVLRNACDWLAGEIHSIYEREATPLMDDIWGARDSYDPTRRDEHRGANQRVRELLELERHALMIFTSCAWFFDDIAGIEPIQNLKYAARAIELTGKDAARLETEFLLRLATAQSNDPGQGNGRDIYLNRVKPRIPAEARLAAGFGLIATENVSITEAQANAFSATGSPPGVAGSLVTLRHRRIGTEHSFRVALLETEIEVTLVEPSLDRSLGWRILEGDLWDRHREMLRKARLHRLFTDIVGNDERHLLTSGDLERSEAVRLGVARALGQSRSGQDADIARALRAIDLLDMLGLSIPFDAQTAFGRALRQAGPDLAARLQALAWRLGFVQK